MNEYKPQFLSRESLVNGSWQQKAYDKGHRFHGAPTNPTEVAQLNDRIEAIEAEKRARQLGQSAVLSAEQETPQVETVAAHYSGSIALDRVMADPHGARKSRYDYLGGLDEARLTKASEESIISA